MNFSRLAAAEAVGAILGHGVRAGRTMLKKGRVLSQADVALLTAAGIDRVMAARLDRDDVPEDQAASRIAAAAQGPGTTAAAPFTGRCNLAAAFRGVAVIDRERLDRINLLGEAVTIATIAPFEVVEPRQMVATIKIIPVAAPAAMVAEAERLAREGGPLVRVARFRRLRVGLVLTRLPGTKESVLDGTVETVIARLAGLDSELAETLRVNHDEAAIARAVLSLRQRGLDLILVNGASAVVDRRDVVPAGIEAAGGVVEHFGMPVDPGNLLLLGHITERGRRVPVLGMPGCARSPKLNGFDWVLQRLAADLPVTRRDIMLMGAGGLLKEIASRPQPRQSESARPEHADQGKSARAIGALVMAAGQSRRMGKTNKLTAEIDGVPMVRRTVESILASRARPVVVVTGHQAEAVRAALRGLDLRFVDNPDYAEGLSTSLRAGLGAFGDTVDGVVVCLGDMPRVRAADIDKLIAAFDPLEGRGICVPTSAGKRGNPVLWARRFFAEMANVAGDVGARHLIGSHAEAVCEVAVDDGGVLIDIDTPEALSRLKTGGA